MSSRRAHHAASSWCSRTSPSTLTGLALHEHVAQLYDDAEDFTAPLTLYIAEALERNRGAIVIAAPSRLGALERNLVTRGLHPHAARRRSQYVTLDAEETLAQFMRDGMPDEERFLASVGKVVDTVAARYGPVNAYGEMVALLSAQGNRQGSLELERSWNRLLVRYPFSLVSGYPARLFSGDPPEQAVLDVCAVHGRTSTPAGAV